MQQPPLYVGMFPPMALPPEAHFPYYPYMYPPGPFALGNPHVYTEPVITGSGKRERTGAETDRKEYRDTEPEKREKNERYVTVNFGQKLSRVNLKYIDDYTALESLGSYGSCDSFVLHK
jgi:hypothetical protein